MLCSMTGYGDASYQSDDFQVAIELRAVNNRYLKVVLRAAEPYNLLEAEFEKVVRKNVRRGAIQIHLRCTRNTRRRTSRSTPSPCEAISISCSPSAGR